MAEIKIKGDSHRYDVRDRECIGLPCLNCHPIQARGATGSSGSRSLGYYHYGCATRNYRGCPQPIPDYDKNLAKERHADGMKVV